MKTRSRRYLGDDRETESDESLYASSTKRRKRIDLRGRIGRLRQSDLRGKIGRYRQSLRLGMQLQYSEKNHLPEDMGREHQDGEKLEKKSSPVISDPSHSSSNQTYVNGDENVDEKKMVRRSTRQRKFMYDNLNQTWLLAPSIPDFSKLEPLFASNERNSRGEEEEECVRPRRSERNRSHELRRLGIPSDSLEFEDMYSRVKRERRKAVHDFYARQIPGDGGSMADTEDTDQNGLSDLDTLGDHSDIEEGIAGEETRDETTHSTKYSLRPKKPITERFQFPIKPVRPRRSASSNIFEAPRHHQPPRERETFKSTAHRSHLFRRKRQAIHHSSSTSSSSDDDRRFEKRKALSMARARNRCLPINFMEEDLNKGVLRDRMKIGCSLADIDPMSIDKSVSFESVGGLDKHIQALKEMILFPLIYPEVFERFKISPPRGVLFHGQPGTGKTLVARALANECSNNDRHIAFFMRKGADCLSKWVGESERQLRLLFDQAYSMRPSIIFFDEIDGLAPVRSTRQDQIHSSIVSTLLALMDGLDNRGEIVIIGATNRIDAIDPALRRPGRFDRELLFPLPSVEARQKILSIHMQHWNPPQPIALIGELAALSVGYCGADLKALCTEAALVALRRKYPQIYGSKHKLQLDVNTIQVISKDFYSAMRKMKPSVQRSSVFSAKPLPEILKPLLDRMLQKAKLKLKRVFPVMAELRDSKNTLNNALASGSSLVPDNSSEDSDCSFTEDNKINDTVPAKANNIFQNSLRFSRYLWPSVHRPCFLLAGEKGQGQGWLAPAVLHLFQHLPIHRLDVPSLYAVTCRSPEEACAQIFHEAQRSLPSIIFLPHIDYWWETLSETIRATFLSLLQDLEPCTPLLLFASSDCSFEQLPEEVQHLFGISEDQVLRMENPAEEGRKRFFACLMREIFTPPKSKKHPTENIIALPVAPSPPPRQLTADELNKLRQREEATLRELRLFLRDILNKLARDRRFYVFARPVDPLEVPDYSEVIKDPMDLETMMTKIDQRKYETVSQFLNDIDLVCQNALEYNPDKDPSDKLIRHRACAFKDIAHALVLSELDEEFEKICQDIQKARKERGECVQNHKNTSSQGLFSVASASSHATDSKGSSQASNVSNLPEYLQANASATRFSKRIRGLDALPENENNKKENYPRRAARYMIWRRRKSPWFGGCRRKLIRQTMHNSSDLIPRKKFKKCQKVLACSVSEPAGSANQKNAESSSKQETHIQDAKMSVANTNIENLALPSEELASHSTAIKNSSPLKHQLEQIACRSTSACNSCDISVDKNCLKTSSWCSVDESSQVVLTKEEQQEGMNHIHENEDNVFQSADAVVEIASNNVNASNSESNTAKLDVIIDMDVLQKTLDRVVKVTRNCTVEALQYLFSLLQQCIYRHRKEWNKQNLLEEIRKEIDRFCQCNLS